MIFAVTHRLLHVGHIYPPAREDVPCSRYCRDIPRILPRSGCQPGAWPLTPTAR